MQSSRFGLFGLLILLFACSSIQVQNPTQASTPTQAVTQISTIDALLQGIYDGVLPLSELRKYGDFGIGTFDRLDGEMMFTDGRFYQIKADGKVYFPDEKTTTPFASVTRFENENSYRLENINYEGLKHFADSVKQTGNLFFALKIRGNFSSVRTRSVPAQTKPYPLLAEVTKNQPEFTMNNLGGQIVGFYCPDFVKGVNVPGYHLHFLSDDKKSGGHLLDFKLTDGELILDQIDRFEMILPTKGDFLGGEFKTDRSEELKKAEQ
jgi:acetolactate decarboxylase